MARKLGQNYRLYVGSGASPEVFSVLAGQRSLTRDESTPLIDQSSKETGQYALQTPGRKALTLTVEGILDLPDANGIERLKTASNADPLVPVAIQIQDTSVSPNAVVFECEMYPGNFNMGADDQDNATYSFSLTAESAPSTDDLSP
jgi:hypothetical protein